MSFPLEIKYEKLDNLNLDPKNPRLGRRNTKNALKQDDILSLMRNWALDELAESFLENGFWPLESLIVIKEKIDGKDGLVVVEGNRRLAALKHLQMAVNGKAPSSRWSNLLNGREIQPVLFERIPIVIVDGRPEVSAFLGFRHVTGIKEWKPAEKAQFIANLIEKEGLSYDDVRRKIGSKTPTVRQLYISYRLLLQMEDQEEIDLEKVEEKFSVLYLSLRTQGVREYLSVNVNAEPEEAKIPVSEDNFGHLVNFSRWLFGEEKILPLVTDSRYVDEFGRILENEEAVKYLERTEHPHWDMAIRLAGEGEKNILNFIETASDNIQIALSEVHFYKGSEQIKKATEKLGKNAFALLDIFPDIKSSLKDN